MKTIQYGFHKLMETIMNGSHMEPAGNQHIAHVAINTHHE